MGSVFWLSLRQLGGRWRMALVLLLAVLPVGLSLLFHFLGGDEEADKRDYINFMLEGLFVGGIMPISMMALSTAAFGNEIEDGTLVYLVLKPISRWKIALHKLLASVAIGGPLLVISGVIVTMVGLNASFQPALAVGVSLFAGAAAYAAIFTWAGLMSRFAIAIALIYVFFWEGLVSSLITGIEYFSVRSYTLALMHGMDESTFEELSERVIELPAAIIGTAAVILISFLLTVRRLRRMDAS